MSDLNVGGQAVIEGVMMRSKDRVATAVRLPDGEIKVKSDPYQAFTARHNWLNVPIVRGAVTFVEMMIVGIKTLNFSAEVAVEEAEKAEAQEKGKEYHGGNKRANSAYLVATAVFAMALGIFVFFFLPLFLSDQFGISREAVSFNLMAGAIRLALFLVYVWSISLFKDFRRIFEYHGAEHKSIFAYEMGEDLLPERAREHTRFHPRCGTSFILIVALSAIFIYSVSDSIFTVIAGHPPELLTRFAVHFSLLPLVAGGSYELLKLSGKTRDNSFTRILIQPGLWLQRITTKEPSLDQLEVAIAALKAALGVEEAAAQPTAQKSAAS